MIICENENDNRRLAILPRVDAIITENGDWKSNKNMKVAISEIMENEELKPEFSKGIPLVFIHKNQPHELTVIGHAVELKDDYIIARIDNDKYSIYLDVFISECKYVVRCHGLMENNDKSLEYMAFSLAPYYNDPETEENDVSISAYATILNTIAYYLVSSWRVLTNNNNEISFNSPKVDVEKTSSVLRDFTEEESKMYTEALNKLYKPLKASPTIFQPADNSKVEIIDTSYKYILYLTKFKGNTLNTLLGIDDTVYNSILSAQRWYERISADIISGNAPIEKQENALSILGNLLKRIITTIENKDKDKEIG